MKKVIRLTESDLEKIVKRILKEQSVVGAPNYGMIDSNPSNSNKPLILSKNSGFILIWAFPEYEPKVDGKGMWVQLLGSTVRLLSGGGTKGTYGKQGHGGCVVIKSNGDATCYEFGRYPGVKKEGYGKVLTHRLGNVAKIKNGKLLNGKQVAELARRKTFPPGPTMSMTVAEVKLPNPSKSIEYASVKERDYSALDFKVGDDANCGTFARDVAYYGGVETGSYCYPTPISVVNSFKDKSDNFYVV